MSGDFATMGQGGSDFASAQEGQYPAQAPVTPEMLEQWRTIYGWSGELPPGSIYNTSPPPPATPLPPGPMPVPETVIPPPPPPPGWGGGQPLQDYPQYYEPPQPPYYPPPAYYEPPTQQPPYQPPVMQPPSQPQYPGYVEPVMRVYEPEAYPPRIEHPAVILETSPVNGPLTGAQIASLWGGARPIAFAAIEAPPAAPVHGNHVFLSASGVAVDAPESGEVGTMGSTASPPTPAKESKEDEIKRVATLVKECWEITGRGPSGTGPYECVRKKCSEVPIGAPYANKEAAPGSVIVNGKPVENEQQAKQWRSLCENRSKSYVSSVEQRGAIDTPRFQKLDDIERLAMGNGECWEITGTGPAGAGPYQCVKKKCSEVKQDLKGEPHPKAAGTVVVNGMPVTNEDQANQWREACENRQKEFGQPIGQPLVGPGLPPRLGPELPGQIVAPPFQQEKEDKDIACKNALNAWWACIAKYEQEVKEWDLKRDDDKQVKRALKDYHADRVKAISDLDSANDKAKKDYAACLATGGIGIGGPAMCWWTKKRTDADNDEKFQEALKEAEEKYRRVLEDYADRVPFPVNTCGKRPCKGSK